MKSLFSTRFLCETLTPFGSPVEPEVYWRKAISVGLVCGVKESASDNEISMLSVMSTVVFGFLVVLYFLN